MSQEDLFRQSLELLQSPVILLEIASKVPLDFRVIYINPQAERITALSRADVYGDTLRNNFPTIEEKFYDMAQEIIWSGAQASVENASYKNNKGSCFVLDLVIDRINKQTLLISATRFATRNSSHLRVYHQSSYDPLTSLLHREAFLWTAEKELKACQAAKEPASFILLDIDRFKAINDQQGHLAGDQALATVAQIILAAIRYQDPAGRLGGDEMAILLPGAGRERALAAAEQILVSLQKEGLSASLGIAQNQDSSLQDLMQAADGAMYRAKKAGGGSIEVARG